jgi:hypothetical protein
MPALINEVIGGTLDNVEIIRDQIAGILKVELANQAVLTGNPQPRVFLERSNPWGMFLEGRATEPPLINVWFDTLTYDGAASNIVERQKAEATYNIDCYGYGISAEDSAGHLPGDQTASLECQRTLRLVRRILMSAHYTYLALRGLVWKRWPQNVSVFQPQVDNRAVQNVVAGRFALSVQFNELSPQITGGPLETLSVEVYRALTGELLMRADYPEE